MTSRERKSVHWLSLAFCVAVFAFAVPTAYSAPSSDAAKVARLSLEVQRTEDLRAVKRLQLSYAQYSQFGLWSQMASLFADNGEAIYGDDDLKGRSAIANYYLTTWGNGTEGLPPGGLHTPLIDTPILTLSADGQSAKGRWQQASLLGQYGGSASWAVGIMENDYVKENGIWKVAKLHYYPVSEGPYEKGWKTVGPAVTQVPFHFTSEQAGAPIPAIPADMKIPAITGSPATALATLNKRITAMNDEDKVANLQNVYGYYIDQKMWDDAADLFTSDGVLEEADAGIWHGAKSIRNSYERFGPQGLKRGQLYNWLTFNLLVSVGPDGKDARTRGTYFVLLGDYIAGTASIGLSIFENHFVKGGDGIWRIREMRVFPIMATDYYQGWAKSRIIAPPVAAPYTPDKPVPSADIGTLTDGTIPAFILPNQVTGKPVTLPKSAKVAAADNLLPAPAAAPVKTEAIRDIDRAIANTGRRLSVAAAYIAVDNISHALGNDIDDQRWHELGQLFAKDGWRAKGAVAFCVGSEHVEACETNYDGIEALPRYLLVAHWLIQSVIDVAPDGKSAKMRNRLIHWVASVNYGAGLTDGMYPNNAAKLEDGVWKLDVGAPDQPYFESPSYADGWARPSTVTPGSRRKVNQVVAPLRNMKPDVPRSDMTLRFHGSLPGDLILWPDIKPMWFAYKNPVSGRIPPLYCPDLKTCEKDLEAEARKK